MKIGGSDGKGKKTRVPWVRLYDPRFSPRATKGWYVVFLFAADGSSLFVSLNQGTDFGTLIWPHFGRLMWPHLIYSDRSSYPVPASRDGEGDGQETQGGTV